MTAGWQDSCKRIHVCIPNISYQAFTSTEYSLYTNLRRESSIISSSSNRLSRVYSALSGPHEVMEYIEPNPNLEWASLDFSYATVSILLEINKYIYLGLNNYTFVEPRFRYLFNFMIVFSTLRIRKRRTV